MHPTHSMMHVHIYPYTPSHAWIQECKTRRCSPHSHMHNIYMIIIRIQNGDVHTDSQMHICTSPTYVHTDTHAHACTHTHTYAHEHYMVHLRAASHKDTLGWGWEVASVCAGSGVWSGGETAVMGNSTECGGVNWCSRYNTKVVCVCVCLIQQPVSTCLQEKYWNTTCNNNMHGGFPRSHCALNKYCTHRHVCHGAYKLYNTSCFPFTL